MRFLAKHAAPLAHSSFFGASDDETIRKFANTWQVLVAPRLMKSFRFGVISSPSENNSSTGTGAQDSETCVDIAETLTWLGHDFAFLRANSDLDVSLRASEVDRCFLALHGNDGGLGQIQALLELRTIPFVGPSSAAISIAYNKVRSRQLLGYHNLPTPASIAVESGGFPESAARHILGWPCVVKPQQGALGRGVFQVRKASDLERVNQFYSEHPQDGVIERFIEGPEFQVFVFNGRVIGIMEVESDFGNNGTQITTMNCPPRLSRGQTDGISRLAKRATQVLGLAHCIARVDVLLCRRHNEIILEVEPLPPLHKNSVVARVARSIGLSYEQLISAVITEDHTVCTPWPTVLPSMSLQPSIR